MKNAVKGGCGCLLITAIAIAVLVMVASQFQIPDGTQPTNLTDEEIALFTPTVFFDDLAAVDIHGNFEKKGFATEKRLGGLTNHWYCSSSIGLTDFRVQIQGISATQISNVQASVTTADPEIPFQLIAEFLTYTASTPAGGADPEAAQKWVSNNWNRTTERRIGTVRYEINHNAPRAWILTLRPAKSEGAK